MGKGKAEDDLDLDLTDEEREALAEQDDEAEAAAKAAAEEDEDAPAIAKAKDKNDDEDEEGDVETGADADKKSGKGEAEDDAAAQAAADKAAADADKGADTDKDADKGEDETKETKAERAAPSPQWEAPADAEAKLKEIADKKGEVADKLDNGDLTAREYQAELDKLNKEERIIEREQDKAQMARDMRESTWFQQTVPAFLAEHTQYEENETLSTMLDAEVRRQQTAAHKRGEDPLSPSIMTKAHAEIVKAVSGLTGKTLDDAEDDDKTAADKAAAAAGKRKAPPKTLAKVPASDPEDTGEEGGEFAALDRLADKDPIAFEDAMGRLSEADQERYLAKH